MSPRSEHDKDFLSHLASCDFTDWTGLPQDCPLGALKTRFTARGSGRGWLGKHEARHTWFDVSGYANPLRVWHDGKIVQAIDVESPAIVSPSKLLERLGEPNVRLDTWWNLLFREDAEWVYSERGLALFVNPTERRIFHLSVFSPTTPQVYEDSLRVSLRMVRLPDRKRS